MKLRYECYGAALSGETLHPQTVMRRLGISYRDAIPQAAGMQWWFVGCTNVPEKLPKYIDVFPESGHATD